MLQLLGEALGMLYQIIKRNHKRQRSQDINKETYDNTFKDLISGIEPTRCKNIKCHF